MESVAVLLSVTSTIVSVSPVKYCVATTASLPGGMFVIQQRRLVRLAPGLALRHVLEVHHCVLHALVRPDADLRLVAGTSANLSVFGGNDFLDGHRALEDDLALDISAPGNGNHVVGKRWNANEDGQECC